MARELEVLYGIKNDAAQSIRARRRANALILLSAGMPVERVVYRSGMSLRAMEAMTERFVSHGLHGAVFDGPRGKGRSRTYDHDAIADVLRKLIASRPPPGMTRWSLVALTRAVRDTIPEAHGITHETIRKMLCRELGIKSVRFIEPYWLTQVRRSA